MIHLDLKLGPKPLQAPWGPFGDQASQTAIEPIQVNSGAPSEFVARDMVNHPPHYNGHPSGVECITVVEHMSFNLGNTVKYIWRAGNKGASIEDLKKAQWYLSREIERLQK